jgi:hypothetical protein
MSDIRAISYDDAQAVTPVVSGNIWTEPAAGFFVNVAGSIQIVTARKTNVTLTVNAGVIYPIAILSVLSGGTTATGIFAVLDGQLYKGTK